MRTKKELLADVERNRPTLETEIARIQDARESGKNPILIALEEASKDFKRWWPFRPSWMRPKKPDPKKPSSGESKKIKEKEPA